VILAGCRGETREGNQASPTAEAPLAEATLAPTYVAVDYAKPGQPKLTSRQLVRLRNVLLLVKPCQHPLLRYVIPPSDFKGLPIAVFFRVVPMVNGYSGSHVFGTTNVMYRFDGEVISTMFQITDAQAIATEKC